MLRDKAGEALWPQETYPAEEVERLSWEQFGDFTLPCPANPQKYLARYGGLILPAIEFELDTGRKRIPSNISIYFYIVDIF